MINQSLIEQTDAMNPLTFHLLTLIDIKKVIING